MKDLMRPAYQPSDPERLKKDEEMGRKLFTLGLRGVCLNWQENALLRSAGMRLRELSAEVRDLRKGGQANDIP